MPATRPPKDSRPLADGPDACPRPMRPCPGRLLGLSLVLSLVLHATASATVLYWVTLWPEQKPETIYSVDLVAPPEPIAPAPQGPLATPPAAPPKPVTAPKPPPCPVLPRPAAPLPRTAAPEAAPEPPGTPTLAAGEPLLEDHDLPEAPAEGPPGGAALISPATRPQPVIPGATKRDLPGVVVKEHSVDVGGQYGFAGFSDTFALEQIGSDVFTEEEYTGHYLTRNNRLVDVVDALASEGRLILHDPGQNNAPGMARDLTRYGKMIYTYGPAFGVATPVEGSVYLLPKKERYDDALINVPNQLMWMPATPPMLYAEKVRFLEQDLEVQNNGLTLKGVLVRCEGPLRPGAVLTFAGCPPCSTLLAAARRHALHGLAVLAVFPRGCGGSQGSGQAARPGDLAGDVLAAARLLRRQQGVDPARVGVIGFGSGAALALKAALDQDTAFAVMACASAAADCALPAPRVSDLLLARCPLLWLLPSRDPDPWPDLRRVLDMAGTKGPALTVRDLADPVPAKANADEARWLRVLDQSAARTAAQWALALP